MGQRCGKKCVKMLTCFSGILKDFGKGKLTDFLGFKTAVVRKIHQSILLCTTDQMDIMGVGSVLVVDIMIVQ